MHVGLTAFRKRTAELRQFLVGNDLHRQLIGNEPDGIPEGALKELYVRFRAHYLQFSTTKTVLDYSTFVISLYGAFEQFIEGIAREYLDAICGMCGDYRKLPDKLVQNHFQLSAQLIQKLDYQRYEGVTTKEEIVANLHSCTATPTTFKLNVHAYLDHTANFRFQSINAFFGQIDIEDLGNRIKLHERMIEHFQKVEPPIDSATAKHEQVFSKLDELADRRNDIAHGEPVETLSPDILGEYLDYFDAYSQAVRDVAYEQVLAFDIKHGAKALGRAIKVIDHRIVCIHMDGVALSEGKTLIAKSANGQIREGKILELQIRNERVPEAGPAAVDVGIRLDCHVKDNCEFFVKSEHQ